MTIISKDKAAIIAEYLIQRRRIVGETSPDLEKAEIEFLANSEVKFDVKIVASESVFEETKEILKDVHTEIMKKIEPEQTNRQAPPALGESLLVLFCPANRADAVLGDLAEQFESEVQKKGVKRATLFYWARAIRSLGPLLGSKFRNTGIWLFVIEIGRRWIGS